MTYSPLFWPVELHGSTIYILDETLLPQKVSYIKVSDYRQACRAIKEMKTRAVGQVLLVMYTFLLALRMSVDKKGRPAVVARVAQALNATRPTLPFKVLTDMVVAWSASGLPLEHCITGFLSKLKAARIRQAEEAAALMKDGDTVLTHCNVSGLMPLIAALCKADGKKISFIVTETRPYLQGSRLSAWELHRAKVPVTLITDSMAAQVMAEGKVNSVMVGADHLAQNGDFANKIGTLQIAICAQHYSLPFYVLCPPPSGAATGADIRIEVRDGKEIVNFNGHLIAAKGVPAYYPAFDVTPARLVTKHIYLHL
jgi:methylthioribose-1-phosphate isomerase